MDLYKTGKIKLSSCEQTNNKNRLTEPEFKQQYLAPIRTLKEHDQCCLLQKIINGELPILGLKAAAFTIKQIDMLKTTFLNHVNIDTWEEAQERLPLFAKTEVLAQFSHLNFSSSVPKSFTEFCTRAKESIDMQTIEESSAGDLVIKSDETDSFTCIIKSAFTELYSARITAINPNFTGAALIVVSIDKVCAFVFHFVIHCNIRI